MTREQPYIEGTYEIVDGDGKVIGCGTCAYYNPKYRPFTDLPKSDGNSRM